MLRLASLCRLPSKVRRRARRSRIITMIIVILTILLFITPFYMIYKPPSLLIRYFQHRWPDVLWQVATSEKVVALTIDDAPSGYTSQILKVLEENDAKATFFVIGGQVQGREEMLQEMVRKGMELGNHAMHDEPSRGLSDAEFGSQIENVQSMVNKAYDDAGVDRPPRYFRPGSGFFSDRMRQRLNTLKYRLVLGSIYPHDPQIPYPRVNAAHILSMVRPGAIIICHDRRSWTVPMLRKVIPEIRRKGYRITTISGLIDPISSQEAMDID